MPRLPPSWNPLHGRVFPVRGVIGAGVALLIAAMAVPWVAVGTGALAFEAPPPVQYHPALVMLPESDGRVLTICQTEVTQAQYRAVTGEDPSDCTYGCGDDLPVHDVSWYDAVDYLNRLSVLEGVAPCYEGTGEDVKWADPTCPGWRLPTDVEWEYAARAGTTTAWSFGDDKAMLDAYAWTENNSGGTAHEVGRLGANPWGLYDVYGNVWEWVWDRTDGGSDNDTPVVSLSASSGPASGSGRVLRGGSFAISAVYTRSSYRDGNNPTSSYWRGGFRCVRGAAPGP